MKNKITASEHLMGCKIIEFVSFLAYWISKKNTTFGARGEFMGNVYNSSIGKTPKDSKIENKKGVFQKVFQKGFGKKEVVWANG